MLQLYLSLCICCHILDIETAFSIHIKGGVAITGVIQLNIYREFKDDLRSA